MAVASSARAGGRVRASRAPVVPGRVPSAGKVRWLSWLFGTDVMWSAPSPSGETELRRSGSDSWLAFWVRAECDRPEVALVGEVDDQVVVPDALVARRILEEGVLARARCFPGWPVLWD